MTISYTSFIPMANDKDLINKVGGRTLFLASEDVPHPVFPMCSYLMRVGRRDEKSRRKHVGSVINIGPPIRMALDLDETRIS